MRTLHTFNTMSIPQLARARIISWAIPRSNSHLHLFYRSKSTMSAPRPSASLLLLSPTNQVLLLHRVNTSTSFPSAHVFPGGNLDAFHDGEIGSGAEQHVDGPAYRMAAVRECFEETGILLARPSSDGGGGDGGGLLEVEDGERDRARRRVHSREVKFGDWLETVGGVPDTGSCLSLPG